MTTRPVTSDLADAAAGAPAINPSAPRPKLHFAFLDAMRGIAALWVVFFHAAADDNLPALKAALPPALFTAVFEWGKFGVPIFFVLSGFVIAHSLRSAIVTWDYTGRFSLRRFLRLTPAYYLSIAFTLVSAFLSAQVKGEAFAPGEQPFTVLRFLAHLVYGQDLLKLVNFNDVYWTLCLEVQFYLVFCGLVGLGQVLVRRSGRPGWLNGPVAIAALLSAAFPLGLLPQPDRVIFLPMMHSFFLGVFAYWVWQKRLDARWFYGYGLLLLPVAIIKGDYFTELCVLVAALFLIVGRLQRMESWLSGRIWQFLGQISYSLYLLHTTILGFAFFAGQKLVGEGLVGEGLSLGFAVVVSVGLSAVAWWAVERPSIQWSRRVSLVRRAA